MLETEFTELNNWMKDIADALSLGFTISACIVVGALIGYFLDSQLNSTPVFLIIGIIGGFIAALLTLYRMVVKKWLMN